MKPMPPALHPYFPDAADPARPWWQVTVNDEEPTERPYDIARDSGHWFAELPEAP